LSTKSDQLEWRRSKIVELRARGLSYADIAQQLQVSKASIVSDVQYLREQAKGTIKESKNILFISKIRYDILCKQLQRYHVR
jgi:transcriptional regulator